MGCVCCSLSSFISIVLDALERITLCTVCALLTCCLMLTLLGVSVIGIGIGFHYCFVQNSVDSMAKAAKAAGALRSGGPNMESAPAPGTNVMRSLDKAVKRGFTHRLRDRREIDAPYPPLNNTYNATSLLNQSYSYNNSMTYLQHKNNSRVRDRRDINVPYPSFHNNTYNFSISSLLNRKNSFKDSIVNVQYKNKNSNYSIPLAQNSIASNSTLNWDPI